MTESTTECPTVDQLRRLIDESLPESEQAVLQQHLDECATCQKLLESLVAGTESWDSAVGHLRGDSKSLDEPVLAEALRRIKGDNFAEASGQPHASARPLDFLEPSDAPGSLGRLGQYEVLEVVGQGGMGVVVKAFDPALHRVVAVKVLAPYLAHSPQARKRFVREAKAVAAVCHDHVITIHAIDESSDQPKIVMQFVAGKSLQQKLDIEGSLDLKEILRIGMQTASGLAAAHAQGLVHRDVKPSNILLENGIQRVKLTDFGLARAVDDASLTQSGVIAGTPQYMAPEQANGDAVDHRADLFSLGSVMYAMCVGHSPFRASTTMGVLKRVCHDPPRPIQELNPDIPGWLSDIILKLLSKTPADRFQSARQVAEVLEKWLAHVQQPTVVPKPASLGQSTDQKPIPTPVNNGVDVATQAVPNFYTRTILFQPISGRMMLFFLLGGMATFMGFGIHHRVPIGELLLVSFLGGGMIAFWALLLAALGRFLWANFMVVVHRARGTTESVSNVPPDTSKQSDSRGFPPESLAMLAAIGSLLLGAHVIIAGIVAIIVWRVAIIMAAPRLATTAVPTPVSGSPETSPTSSSIQAGLTRALHLGGERLLRMFDLEPTERTHLFLVIGWCFVGAVDLVWLLVLSEALSQPGMHPVIAGAMILSLVSFAMSFCINVRQNLDKVRSGAFLGLLPISVGAFLRVPLSVVTLFWLQRPEVRQSFSSIPWHETDLGRLFKRGRTRLNRSLVTFAWLVGWSLLCFVVSIGFFVGYAVPYGPSIYRVTDHSADHVVNKEHNLTFGLQAWGTGQSSGSGLSGNVFRCDGLTLHSNDSSGRVRQLTLRLESPVKMAGNGPHRELVQTDIEGFFHMISGNPYPEQAASLFQTIQQIRPAQESVKPRDPRTLSLFEQMQDRNYALFDASMKRLPESVPYAEVRTLIDPDQFEVRKITDRAVFQTCRPADWLVATVVCSSLGIWLSGAWWIVFRRNRRHKTATGAT